MTHIIWASIFALFGFVYFRYGKKQAKDIPFFSGIILMIFPYFVHNLYIMVPVGIILIISPFVIKR